MVEDEFISWADSIPSAAGLYNPELEKDACGVGFLVNIKGVEAHSIVKDARNILCNMTHRGAVGADVRDGDGAGVMTAIPHLYFEQVLKDSFYVNLPAKGTFAVGNVFFKPEPEVLNESKATFERIAFELGLSVLCWRPVPRDNSGLGPSAKGKEPIILQPFVTPVDNHDQDGPAEFDEKAFQHKLYLLR